MQRTPLTKSGYEQLEKILHHYKTAERRQVIEDIAEARAHGDLSENAEYDAAKERQGFIEARINELENQVASAEVIDPASLESDIVVFGATVRLLDIDTDETVTYSIVGDAESSPENGLLGISTPVARAMMGKEEMDEIVVRTPGGTRTFEIETIEYKEIDVSHMAQ